MQNNVVDQSIQLEDSNEIKDVSADIKKIKSVVADEDQVKMTSEVANELEN